MLNQKRSVARCGEDCCHESEEDSHCDDEQVRQLELQRSNHGSRKRGCLIFFSFLSFLCGFSGGIVAVEFLRGWKRAALVFFFVLDSLSSNCNALSRVSVFFSFLWRVFFFPSAEVEEQLGTIGSRSRELRESLLWLLESELAARSDDGAGRSYAALSCQLVLSDLRAKASRS